MYNPLPFSTQSRLLMTLRRKPFENTVGKGEIEMLVTSIFPFSHNVFNFIIETLRHLNNTEIVICKCFQFVVV